MWQIGLRVYTLSSPYVNEVPAFFINQATANPTYRAAWLAITQPGELDGLNETLLRAAIYSNPNGPQTAAGLGNARDVARQLIRRDLPLAELNLDADRGYGYFRWRANGSLPGCCHHCRTGGGLASRRATRHHPALPAARVRYLIADFANRITMIHYPLASGLLIVKYNDRIPTDSRRRQRATSGFSGA